MSEYLNEKRYVVAWINFYDNVLHQEVVNALHMYHAIEVSKQELVTLEDMHECATLEQLKVRAFDADGMLSVIEV